MKYISGLHALNIPCRLETVRDSTLDRHRPIHGKGVSNEVDSFQKGARGE